MDTVIVFLGSAFFVWWGITCLLHPDKLRSGFKDEYLRKEWYLGFVRIMGAIAIVAGIAVICVYLNSHPRIAGAGSAASSN